MQTTEQTLDLVGKFNVLFEIIARQELGRRTVTRKRGESRTSVKQRRNPRRTITIPYHMEITGTKRDIRSRIKNETESVVRKRGDIAWHKIKITQIKSALLPLSNTPVMSQ